MYKIKLGKKIKLSGNIEALSGLHIGASSQGLEIGGVDNAIVRDPLTNQPYIPGSSLKGKMRSLLEKALGIQDIDIKINNGEKTIKKFTKTGVCQDPNEKIAQLFGLPAEVAEVAKVPSARLIVRDAYLSPKSEEQLFSSKFTDSPYTEIKTEIVVDRVTSAATPRPLERVPKGAIFEFEMILNIFESDDEKEYINLINKAFALLNDDYLGGSGSRGSGKISIKLNDSLQVKTAEDYKDLKGWSSYTMDQN